MRRLSHSCTDNRYCMLGGSPGEDVATQDAQPPHGQSETSAAVCVLGNIDYLLPSLAQLERGSKIMHAAVLVDVPYPSSKIGNRTYPGGTFRYPKLTALCGVRGWGKGSSPVTCGRCLAVLASGKWAR